MNDEARSTDTRTLFLLSTVISYCDFFPVKSEIRLFLKVLISVYVNTAALLGTTTRIKYFE